MQVFFLEKEKRIMLNLIMFFWRFYGNKKDNHREKS